MAEICKDLPDECWELIFNKLGHHSHLETLALVCKRFLSIISNLHTSFNVTLPTVLVHGDNLSSLFNRFPKIKSINLCKTNYRGSFVDQIILSSLSIESLNISDGVFFPMDRFKLLGQKMKSFRALKCSKMYGSSNHRLSVIADSLPWMEELDISYPQLLYDPQDSQWGSVGGMCLTDDGIEMLSLKLKGLRKIDISGNQFLSDRSLMALSTNSAYLTEIVVRECAMITASGIKFLVRNCQNLRSLSVSEIDFRTPALNFSTRDSFTRAKCLSTLDIDNSGVSNDFLYALAMSAIPLKKFTLAHCYGFTFDGIKSLLQRYQSLEYLALIDARISDDGSFAEFSNSFCLLTTIKLRICYLTESTFFMLSKNCPLLEDVDMGYTNIGKGGNRVDFVKNPQIKSLKLTCNPNLNDECLTKLASACPFLEMLDASYCTCITERGIANFLTQCFNISHLEINGCEGISNIGKGVDLPNLKVLLAANSGIDDAGLRIIGKRCCELLNLDLQSCLGVTSKGLKEMLVDCRRLRKINLNQCVNVAVEIIDWMVFSRPSLRKIIPPSSSFPDVSQMKFYLHHGCFVWKEPPVDVG